MKRKNSGTITQLERSGKQIKYSRLSRDFSNPTNKKAFELLETARLFRRVSAASPSGIPLGACMSEKKFKAVFLDIGLMTHILGLQTNNIL
jgi:predicted AAA+ superfamily ATPase